MGRNLPKSVTLFCNTVTKKRNTLVKCVTFLNLGSKVLEWLRTLRSDLLQKSVTMLRFLERICNNVNVV